MTEKMREGPSMGSPTGQLSTSERSDKMSIWNMMKYKYPPGSFWKISFRSSFDPNEVKK